MEILGDFISIRNFLLGAHFWPILLHQCTHFYSVVHVSCSHDYITFSFPFVPQQTVPLNLDISPSPSKNHQGVSMGGCNTSGKRHFV